MNVLLAALLGFDTDEGDPPRGAALNHNPPVGAELIANMVAKQVEVEQGLSGTRMTWNLTFQGFTIAGYALVATSDGSAPGRAAVQALIALVSIVVAFASLRGLVASQRQRAYLRRVWSANGLSAYFPEPFSDSHGSRLGRAQGQWICWVLMAMWGFLLLAGQLITRDMQDPTSVVVKMDGPLRVLPALPMPVTPPKSRDRTAAIPPRK